MRDYRWVDHDLVACITGHCYVCHRSVCNQKRPISGRRRELVSRSRHTGQSRTETIHRNVGEPKLAVDRYRCGRVVSNVGVAREWWSATNDGGLRGITRRVVRC